MHLSRPFPVKNNGFTLIEIAIVLVIVGIILSIGTASWVTFMEGRRVAKTRSVLQQAKDCLVRRVVFNERYPREEDFDACVGEAGRDGWNGEVRWLRGVNGTNATLDETMFVVTDEARNQNATYPGDASQVRINGDALGEQPKGVAFVLVSRGDNGEWDDGSYGDLLSGSNPVLDPDAIPDFSGTRDDIYMLVKGYELTSAIRNAVGH